MKSIPLSVKVAGPSLAPSTSFLFNNSRTWIMGVLNATPDSFYAGSRAAQREAALHLAEEMIDDGADLLDIGGESTRPGAEEIPASVELERVLPVIDALHVRWPEIPLSIDTRKGEVARQSLARGASLINDISALRSDPAMVEVMAESGAPVVLMHMQGTPRTMQARPAYENVVDEVKKFFEERLAFVIHQNIREENVILDPGIGFGKTLEHNLEILRRMNEFLPLGRPLLVGVSRKSFIGKLLSQASPHASLAPLPMGEGASNPLLSGEGTTRLGEAFPPEERLEGSLAAALWAVQSGARGLRVHDVGSTRRALCVWEGVRAS